MPSIRSTMEQFSSNFFNRYSTSTPVNILWEEFKSLCNTCLSHIPTKTSNTRSHGLTLTSNVSHTESNGYTYYLAKSSSCPIKWQTYRNFKKTVQQESRSLRAYHKSLTDGNGGITKRLWSYIEKKWKGNFGVASLKNNDNAVADTGGCNGFPSERACTRNQ